MKDLTIDEEHQAMINWRWGTFKKYVDELNAVPNIGETRQSFTSDQISNLYRILREMDCCVATIKHHQDELNKINK